MTFPPQPTAVLSNETLRALTGASETLTYAVPDMSRGHCKTAVIEEVSDVAGVEAVEVDLDTKRVHGASPAAPAGYHQAPGLEAALVTNSREAR